jgi:hypothetical protein
MLLTSMDEAMYPPTIKGLPLQAISSHHYFGAGRFSQRPSDKNHLNHAARLLLPQADIDLSGTQPMEPTSASPDIDLSGTQPMEPTSASPDIMKDRGASQMTSKLADSTERGHQAPLSRTSSRGPGNSAAITVSQLILLDSSQRATPALPVALSQGSKLTSARLTHPFLSTETKALLLEQAMTGKHLRDPTVLHHTMSLSCSLLPLSCSFQTKIAHEGA